MENTHDLLVGTLSIRIPSCMDEEFEHLFNIRKLPVNIYGQTIRKVMGGGGGTKKNSCKGKCQEKIHAKKKVKKKIHAEGRSNCDFLRKSEFLSESLSFRNQQYYQAQCE